MTPKNKVAYGVNNNHLLFGLYEEIGHLWEDFLKMGQSLFLFLFFCLFHMIQFKYKWIKA